MLFVGGGGSVAHMHYDIDLSHIFHTQFIGRKGYCCWKTTRLS